LEPIIGRRFGGILGHDFFERFVVRIDYSAHTVTLFDPATFTDSAGTSVPLWLEAQEPFFVGTLFLGGRAHTAKLKVDTGSLDFIGLNGSFVAQTRLVPTGHPTLPAIGAAVGGNPDGFYTALDSFALGGWVVRRPMIGYSASVERIGDAGTIGARFLSRFAITFDYRRHRLLLRSEVEPATPPSADASGTLLVTTDSLFRTIGVQNVMPNTPASSAGLRPGDRLDAIGGDSTVVHDLWAVRRLFDIPDTTYSLTIGRGAKREQLTIRTKRLL
jgi:hypothetical protein